MSSPRRISCSLMSANPANYQYILWDNDGVLVDTEQWYFAATREAMAELGVDLPIDTYQQIMIQGRSSWELALQAGVHPDRVRHGQERRDVLYQAYLRSEDLRIEGVLEVLAELAPRRAPRQTPGGPAARVEFRPEPRIFERNRERCRLARVARA